MKGCKLEKHFEQGSFQYYVPSLSIRTIACSLQLKTDDLLIYFFSRFFRRIEPSRTKYPPTDTNTESSAEQSTEMNSISTQSDPDDLSTPTVQKRQVKATPNTKSAILNKAAVNKDITMMMLLNKKLMMMHPLKDDNHRYR